MNRKQDRTFEFTNQFVFIDRMQFVIIGRQKWSPQQDAKAYISSSRWVYFPWYDRLWQTSQIEIESFIINDKLNYTIYQRHHNALFVFKII